MKHICAINVDYTTEELMSLHHILIAYAYNDNDVDTDDYLDSSVYIEKFCNILSDYDFDQYDAIDSIDNNVGNSSTIYCLMDIIFSTPFEDLPLAINDKIGYVALIAKWRLKEAGK